MKSGEANVLESTSKQSQQLVVQCTEPVNNITAQFQLFALPSREHIDLLNWHYKTTRTDCQICVWRICIACRKMSAVKRLSDRLAVSTELRS